MKLNKQLGYLAIALMASTLLTVKAASPLGGLAIALSDDESTLAAAGDNRTLYLVDAKSLNVKERYWLGSTIVNVAFNKDGSRIIVEDTSATLHLVDSNTGKIVGELKKAEKMAVLQEQNLAAVVNPDSKGHVIRLVSLNDLSVKGEITLQKGDKVACLALSPSGDQVAAWLDPANDPEEPKESKVPAGVKGLEADEFKQKHDGKTSRLLQFKVADGASISDHKLYYSPSGSSVGLYYVGSDLLIVSYSNINAKVSPDGAITLFKLANSFNYGIGAAGSNSLLLTGGLAKGTQTKTSDMSQTAFEVAPRLPGWPEYFKSFTAGKSGTGFGTTSGYRVIKINPDGTRASITPIF